MERLRAIDRTPQRWKNGGGVTHEIARSPSGGGDFDWRVSIAIIDGNGDFSRYPGIDRSLVVIEGRGVLLHRNGVVTSQTIDGPPLVFDGDEPIFAETIAGPTRDLNVMTRRACCRHAITRLDLTDPMVAAPARGARLVVALTGIVTVSDGDAIVELTPADAILARNPTTQLALDGIGASVYLIDIWSVATTAEIGVRE